MKDKIDKITKQQIERFYESVGTPIIITDLSGLICYINESAEALLGYPRNALLNKEFATLVGSSTVNRVKSLISLVESQNPRQFLRENELEVIKKSGRPLAVNADITSLDVNKDILCVFSLHDISDLKRIQKEKEQSLKEVARVTKLADIGRLAAGVAHEINNPLAIIHGYAENIIALISSDQLDKEKLKNQTEPIMKAAKRMARITSTMLRMTRRDEVKFIPENLASLINEIVNFMSRHFKESNIEVNKKLENDIIVHCDRNQMEQVILNILNNAVSALKNIDGKRKISISLRKNKNKNVLLSISNNGPKIPDDIQENILTPFFTTKSSKEGTGLGLSICFGIMKAHDGELSFKSDKKRTVFYLKFPEASFKKIL